MSVVDPEMLTQFVDVLPVGVCIIGMDRKIVFWNQAAARITGRRAHDVIGHSCREEVLLHCAANGVPVCGSEKCLFTSAQRNGAQLDARLFAQHKEGHRIPLQVRSVPLCDAHGKVVAVAELFQQENIGTELHWMVETAPSAAAMYGDVKVPSLAVTETHIRARLAESPRGMAVFLLRVENLQEMTKHRGVEMAQAMLRALLQTLNELMQMPHFIGQWTEHRFLVMVPGLTSDSYRELLEEFKGVAGTCSVIWWGDKVTARIDVRGTLVKANDSLETVMSRVEETAPASDRAGDNSPCS